MVAACPQLNAEPSSVTSAASWRNVTAFLRSPSRFLSKRLSLRVTTGCAYDAVQLAAALEVGRLHQAVGLGSVTLISADGELNIAATVEGLRVDDPNAHV